MVTVHHHRKSIRLKGFDYSYSAYYFITICTFGKQNLFGAIIHEAMQLNALGKIVEEEWQKTAAIRKNVLLDAFICMPDHIHGIIGLVDVDDGRDTSRRAPTKEQFGKPVSGSIPTIVRLFKSSVAKRINEVHSTPQQPVWQRGYYEHIIRNDKELDNIPRYIIGNPVVWKMDKEYPENIKQLIE
jgi:putative transposase